jgi:hypothetical protein
MFNSGFSYAKEIAENISVPKSMLKMWIVAKGRGIWASMSIMNGKISSASIDFSMLLDASHNPPNFYSNGLRIIDVQFCS